MANNLLKIFKETALPGSLQPNSVYLVAPAASDYVEMYVTGTSASTVRRVISETDVQAMIDASTGGGSGADKLLVVADIAARDALTLTENTLVLVKDATADSTVSTGAATYIYDAALDTFTKIAEYESLDLTLSWANIVGKPTSSTADIDDAVAKRHSHTNMTQLNKVGEDGNGNFTYNGQYPDAGLSSQNW